MSEQMPSVGLSPYIKLLRDEFGFDTVDIDFPELNRTLDEMGEFGYPDRVPLHINISAMNRPRFGQPEAYAMLFTDEDGAPTQRYINVSLGQIYKAGLRKSRVVLDPKRLNLVLAHELRHAVDYNDAELVERHRTEQEAVRQESKKHEKTFKIGAGTLAIGGLSLLTKGLVDRQLVEMWGGEMAAMGAYVPYLMARSARLAYLKSGILEQRAYSLQYELQKSKSIPEIINIYN